MRFEELSAFVRSLDLGVPGCKTRPPRENVRAVQNAVSASLAEEDFCLDCIELELGAALAAKQRPGGPANHPPFHALAERGISFRFFYWPPGKDAPPHEHTSWTVTAVFHNALTVTTYDWQTAVKERRLAPRSVFAAERGRAGHIYDDSIHRPSNPTDRLTASLHIFNSNDGPLLAETVGPIAGLAEDMAPGRWPVDAPGFEEALARRRRKLLLMLADMLAPFRSRRAVALLDRIYELGEPLVRFVVSLVLRAIDPERATLRLDELVEQAPEFRERVALVTLRS